MLLRVLCSLVVVQVLSVVSLEPPQNIHVDNWRLTWTPASEDGDVTYSIRYSSFDSGVWTDVPDCIHISSTYCNVSATKVKGEHGCVRLRVQAEKRGGLTSKPVEACSSHGDSCTPDFSLTTGPGSLTVHLSRDHDVTRTDHGIHRVYYGKQGEPLEMYKDAWASVTIPELQEGQRYCTKVQYVEMDVPVGLPTCMQCELIPESRNDSQIMLVLVPVAVLLLLTPVIAYCLIFQRGRVKQWLRPPCEIPDNFLLEPVPEHRRRLPVLYSDPPEEHYDVITVMFPAESRE